MYFHYFVIISPWKWAWSLIWQTRIPSTQGWFVPSLMGSRHSGSVKENFLILSMYFCYFVIISFCKWSWSFIWRNLNPIHPRVICAKFDGKVAQWFWKRRFLNFINIILIFCYYFNEFLLFHYSLPLEKVVELYSTNLNPLHPKMFCANFGRNWPSGSGEAVECMKNLQERW